MKRGDFIIKEDINSLIKKIAIPASVGLFFNTMFNVVDTYFAGYISTTALASLSLSFPVFFLIIAIGSGFASGLTALIGNSLGGNEQEKSKMFAAQGISFAFILSIILTIMGLLVSKKLFIILQADGEYLNSALAYMDTIFIGTACFVFIFMLNSMLNAQGDTKSFRNFLMFAFCTNIVLDYFFVKPPFWIEPQGIKGLAYATIIIEFFGVLYIFKKVKNSGILDGVVIKDLIPRKEYIKEILHQGFPSTMNMFTISAGVFVITYFISSYGKEAVAAFGIGMRVEQIILLPAIGLNIAVLSITAQNSGAKMFDRVRKTLYISIFYGGVITIVGAIVLIGFGEYLIALFTDNIQVRTYGYEYLKIDSLALFAYVLIFINNALLQGIKRPSFLLYMGLFRQIIAPLIIFFVLTQIFKTPLIGIWIGVLCITWFAAIVTIFYARNSLSKIEKC